MSKIKTLRYFIDYVERNSLSPSDSDVLAKYEDVLDNEIIFTINEDGVCCECSTGVNNTYLLGSYSSYDDYTTALGIGYGCPDCQINSVTNIGDFSSLVISSKYYGCKFNNTNYCAEFNDNINTMIIGYGTGFTNDLINYGIVEQGKSNLSIVRQYLQSKSSFFANQFMSLIQSKGITSTCGYILDTPIISSIPNLINTYNNGLNMCFNIIGEFGNVSLTATTSGVYGGKNYYDLDINTSIIWSSVNSRWECWEYFDPILGPAGNLYAHLDFQGNEPITSAQYNWVSDFPLFYILTSTLGCLEGACVVWGSEALTVGTFYGNANVVGYYDGKYVFEVKSYIESNEIDFYVLWNSGNTRWESWEIFDITNPSLGPSGDFNGYTNYLGDYPLSSSYYPWVSEFSSPLFVYESTKGNCYSQICFSYYYNGIGYGTQGNSQIGIYSNKPVYYLIVDSVFTYIVWNSVSSRWEQWSNFNVNTGGFGTLYSYNNEQGNLPVSDTYSWIDNSGGQYYITSSTTDICLP